MTMLIYTLLAVVLGVLAQTGFGVMVGGYRPVDLTNPSRLEHVTQLALFGIKAIAAERAKAQSTAGNTLETKYSLINITSAKSQIVAGVNYFITIEMQPEECAASTTTAATATAQSSADPLSCELKREECELTIWEQVWLNSTELTNFECTTRRVANNLGARHRISNDDKSAQHALTFATAELNKFYKQPVYYVAVVQNTYKQVVNGIKYTFEFEYAPTSCLVSEENMAEFKSEEECKVDASKDTMSCVVSVLDQFWLADEETTQSDSSSSQQNDDSNAAAADKKYEVVDKPSRYTLILKNCT